MARRVDELNISNWTNLGSTAPVPQWTVDVEVKWIKDDETEGYHSDTYTFPNILGGVSQRRIKRYMEAIIQQEVRIAIGIDNAEDIP